METPHLVPPTLFDWAAGFRLYPCILSGQKIALIGPFAADQENLQVVPADGDVGLLQGRCLGGVLQPTINDGKW